MKSSSIVIIPSLAGRMVNVKSLAVAVERSFGEREARWRRRRTNRTNQMRQLMAARLRINSKMNLMPGKNQTLTPQVMMHGPLKGKLGKMVASEIASKTDQTNTLDKF